MRAETVLVLAALAAACSQKMREQPRCEPLGPSRLFADGRCARDPVPGTVARGAAHDPLAGFDPNLVEQGRQGLEVAKAGAGEAEGVAENVELGVSLGAHEATLNE